MAMAMLLVLTLKTTVSTITILMYDAELDAGVVQQNKRLVTNIPLATIGQDLPREVEAANILLLWIKVKGHSKDVVNDKANELAPTVETARQPLKN